MLELGILTDSPNKTMEIWQSNDLGSKLCRDTGAWPLLCVIKTKEWECYL